MNASPTSNPMSARKNYTSTEGYTEIVKPGEMGITKLHFGILTLTPQTTFFDHSDDAEVALIALGGHCTLLVGHNGNKAYGVLGERSNVFEGEACVAHIPHHTTYEMLVGEAGVEIAVCKVESHSESAAVILEAGETAPEQETHLRIWENIADVSTSDTPVIPTQGEAICFYRSLDVNRSAVFEVTRTVGDKRTARVQLSNNDVLMLSEQDNILSLTSEGGGYQLWVQPNL
ncbi:MAG: 5-deoxy-glucuronate isomerase [Candidatus Poribacteria bacterium]|nr:5-deoxy-glucuronate isomerase [Candidatus Poribacteria bacterium]